MKINRTAAAILFTMLFIGCAATARDQGGSRELQTVSVSSFTCANPLIAQDVRNAIIGSLLDAYSVTTGEGAGVVIKGAIILAGDTSSDSNISEIKATVLRGGKIMGAVTLTRAEAALSSDASPEAMGKKIGTKIREILSR
ncbi:MAG: hypothetical protein HZC49_09520 [Nitrospirae bacterium]|nr:hypothetical protein [Nitrospirota bacterium]